MALFGKSQSSDLDKASDELPSMYRKIMDVFNKVYNSETYRERREDFDRWLDLYKGELWYDDLEEWESKIQVNYIFINIQAQCPLLTDNRPVWHIRAREPVFQNLANLYGKGLEYYWDKEEMDNVHYLVEKDALLYGTGLTKHSWNVEEDDIKVDMVDPKTFVIAPGFDDLWKAPWCGTKTRQSMSWVKMNYPKAFKKVKPDVEDHAYDPTNRVEMELEQDEVTVYEIWIRDSEMVDYLVTETEKDKDGNDVQVEKKQQKKKYPNGRIITFTKDVVLSDEESPFKHGKPPYVAFYDYRVPHEFWGMGEPQQIEELHREFNKQLQAAVKHARLSENPNYLLDPDALMDVEEVKDEFWDGGNMWIASFDRNQTPIVKVETGTMDAVHLDLIRILPQAIQEVSGITDMTKGMASKKERQSASEVSILIESSYTRTRQKVRILEWSIKREATMHVEMMQQFYDSPRYINFKREGSEGQELQYAQIGNSANVLRATNMPERFQLESGEPEPEDDYQKRVKGDPIVQRTEELIRKTYHNFEAVTFKFDVEIQTNSTLPQDRQSLANLILRLAEIQMTPNSVVDDQAVMEFLQLPGREAIKARKEKMRQEAIQAKQMAEAAKNQPPQPGPRPIPAGGRPEMPMPAAVGGQR